MPPTPPESRVRVSLSGQPARTYEVLIGSGLLASLGHLLLNTAARPNSRIFLITDSGLPQPTIALAQHSLAAAGLTPIRAAASATEPEKSLKSAEALLSHIAALALDRREPVVALGGGIIGDLAGFVAATYRRGVPIIQCPTTLLSMVDASVGGKTGVNLATPGELQKNMVGAFHQPRAVIADVNTLASLSDRHLRAGLAECIKHGLIAADFGDPALLDWTESNLRQILARDAATLIELITRNVRIKAAVIGDDEREESDTGGRALLNLGHTFAHAIETLPDLSPDNTPAPLQHGEAVALGLIAAATCAESASRCPPGLAARVRSIIAQAGLPTAIKNLPTHDDLLARMRHDKKVIAGALRLVLPVAPGRAALFADTPETAIRAGLNAIRA